MNDFLGIQRSIEDDRHNELINAYQQQTLLINQQTKFTKILALATVILALGTFFQMMDLINNWGVLDYNVTEDWLTVWMAKIFFGLAAMLIIFLVVLVFKYRVYETKK